MGPSTLKVKATKHPVHLPGSGGIPSKLKYLQPGQVVEVPNERFFRRRIAAGDLELVGDGPGAEPIATNADAGKARR